MATEELGGRSGHGSAPGPLGGIGAVAAAYIGGLIGATLLVSLAVAAGAAADGSVANVVSFLGEWVGFVGVPVYLSRTRGTASLARDVGLRLRGPVDIGLGLAGGLAGYGLVAAYSAVLSTFDHVDLGQEANQLAGHGKGIDAAFVAFALCAAVGAPIAEEILFRGLTQPIAQRRLGAIPGLVVTAVAFGAVHLTGNPIEAIPPLIAFGAILGTLAWRTGRLGPGIVAHVVFNGITVALLAAGR